MNSIDPWLERQLVSNSLRSESELELETGFKRALSNQTWHPATPRRSQGVHARLRHRRPISVYVFQKFWNPRREVLGALLVSGD